jgi:hypothetical protein
VIPRFDDLLGLGQRREPVHIQALGVIGRFSWSGEVDLSAVLIRSTWESSFLGTRTAAHPKIEKQLNPNVYRPFSNVSDNDGALAHPSSTTQLGQSERQANGISATWATCFESCIRRARRIVLCTYKGC